MNKVSYLLPEPVDMGMPPKFLEWRQGQDEAIVGVVASDRRFQALVLPCGAGKSLTAIGVASLQDGRALYLTSTKGLQNQIHGDFQEIGLTDIRGQNNYPCHFAIRGGPENGSGSHLRGDLSHFQGKRDLEGKDAIGCDEGPCHAGIKCDLMEAGCSYFDSVNEAKKSRLVVTNYSYWMHQVEHGKGMGPFSLLILDEGHAALDELSDYLSVEISAKEFEGLLGIPIPEEHNGNGNPVEGEPGPIHTELGWWKRQAQVWMGQVCKEIESRSAHVKVTGDRREIGLIRGLKGLQKKLSRLSTMSGEWVTETVRRGPLGGLIVRFHPVWAGDYAERHLFAGIPKVLLMSATIRPKTLQLLNVPEDEMEFAEYPSQFPVERRPVTFIPTVRVDKKATQETLRGWVDRIDTIIGQRRDRKGLVHTVSYERAHYFARHSHHQDILMLHDTKTAQETIRRFKQKDGPAVLVSPSTTTGYDFPDSEARYQIIAKVPFPDSRDKVLQARAERDSEYSAYSTMQTIVQTAGRIVRSESDFGESFIVDSHWEWFYPKFRRFAPTWFQQSVRTSHVIPKPISF